MRHHITLTLLVILIIVMVSCQSAASTPSIPTSTSTLPGQMETKVAATIYANETSTAGAMIADQTATAEAKGPEPTSGLEVYLLTKAAVTPISIYKVSVPASACWMNSEVDVLTGQEITITASGIWNTHGGNEDSNSGPEGQKYICGAIECPVQGVGYGALVGRLGDLKPFFVGKSLRFTASQDGQLYFTVNDWECEDNSGVIELKITIP